MLDPRKVLARPRSAQGCTRMPNTVAPNSFHQSPSSHPDVWWHSGCDLLRAQAAVTKFCICQAALPGSAPLRKDCKRSLLWAWWEGSPQPEKGSGARERKADSLLTLLCSHEGCQKCRSSRNKVSGAVLPVALLPVMTLCLFTLESCTTSILYNRS